MKKILIVVFLSLLVGGCAMKPPPTPDAFGNYAGLVDLNGKPASISQFGGKLILVNFLASWCKSCIGELPTLEILARDLRGEGLQVVGVGIDDTEAAFKELKQIANIAIPVLFDKQGTVKSAFGIRGLPRTILFRANGERVTFYDGERHTYVLEANGPRDWSDEAIVTEFRKALRRESGEGAQTPTTR